MIFIICHPVTVMNVWFFFWISLVPKDIYCANVAVTLILVDIKDRIVRIYAIIYVFPVSVRSRCLSWLISLSYLYIHILTCSRVEYRWNTTSSTLRNDHFFLIKTWYRGTSCRYLVLLEAVLFLRTRNVASSKQEKAPTYVWSSRQFVYFMSFLTESMG